MTMLQIKSVFKLNIRTKRNNDIFNDHGFFYFFNLNKTDATMYVFMALSTDVLPFFL